ncbi:putative rmlC-like cupin domain superfamily, rmlC-like jelly roll protein [Septoria linicola]|nr:putative rmlC-like cupin domain superfamily, rmlC-like jelly roll protein [Septoria linicola]
MVEVKAYKLPPTPLIPNSPYPLLHYPGVLSKKAGSEYYDAGDVYDMFQRNGWGVQWIFRYGPTQESHYHSAAHECMAVLSGTATIRFGVADTSEDLEESTHGKGWESGALELHAKAGDVFVLPAGLAHKTYDTTPAEFALLTPGRDAKWSSQLPEPAKTLRSIQLDGFTMLGAYPIGSRWDFAIGGKDDGHFQETWSVPKPEKDPVIGSAPEGLIGQWKATRKAKL